MSVKCVQMCVSCQSVQVEVNMLLVPCCRLLADSDPSQSHFWSLPSCVIMLSFPPHVMIFHTSFLTSKAFWKSSWMSWTFSDRNVHVLWISVAKLLDFLDPFAIRYIFSQWFTYMKKKKRISKSNRNMLVARVLHFPAFHPMCHHHHTQSPVSTHCL